MGILGIRLERILSKLNKRTRRDFLPKQMGFQLPKSEEDWLNQIWRFRFQARIPCKLALRWFMNWVQAMRHQIYVEPRMPGAMIIDTAGCLPPQLKGSLTCRCKRSSQCLDTPKKNKDEITVNHKNSCRNHAEEGMRRVWMSFKTL